MSGVSSFKPRTTHADESRPATCAPGGKPTLVTSTPELAAIAKGGRRDSEAKRCVTCDNLR